MKILLKYNLNIIAFVNIYFDGEENLKKKMTHWLATKKEFINRAQLP